MNYIVYDIEATCWRGRPPKVQETIEIGAVKINNFGEIEGVFSRFIRPVVSPYLSTFCRELTSIKQRDVDMADTFTTVIEDFQDWIGIYDEDYLLCSWGSFDKRQLVSDCKLHDLEYDWLDNYINVKEQYRTLKKLPKPWGLKKTTEKEGFEFTGIQHRAIADAENLGKVFSKYIDEWMF